MTRDDTDTPDSQGTFNLPRWHDACELWLDFCAQYWEHFRREREAARLDRAYDEGWGGEVPYHEIENKYGRRLPAVARAAAGLRRSLALALDHLLPDAEVVAPDGDDEVERAMAESAGWEEAVGIALADVRRMKELLASIRPEWRVTAASDIPEVIELLRAEMERQARHFEALTLPRLARLSAGTLGKDGYTRVPADRINKAVIEALAPGAMKELPAGYLSIFGPGVTFWRAYAFGTGRRPSDYDQLVGVIGLREEVDESQWRLLHRSSALAVKIHLALWERTYVEAAGVGTYATEGEPLAPDYVTTTLARLCDDIGLKRKKGAHKRESREAVARLLKLLTSLELICLYKPPLNVPPETIRGSVWRRGVVPEGPGLYGDLFAAEACGGLDGARQAFSYAPGRYFRHGTWRKHNKYVALVHAGLLGMSCAGSHRWAVMVGAYLSLLARINRYRRTPLSLRTVAERTGLWAVYGAKEHGEVESQLGAAFNRLREAGVIKSIEWHKSNDPEALFADGGEGTTGVDAGKRAGRTKGGVRERDLKFEVEWPDEVRERGRHLSERRRKKRAPKSRRSSGAAS